MEDGSDGKLSSWTALQKQVNEKREKVAVTRDGATKGGRGRSMQRKVVMECSKRGGGGS